MEVSLHKEAAPGFSRPAPWTSYQESSACTATNWINITLNVTEVSESRHVSEAHVAWSALSALSCLAVIGISLRFPSLRKFPSNMLLWKTACDLMTSLVILGINVSLLLGEDDQQFPVGKRQFEVGSRLCSNGVLAGVMGFCLLASPGWFVTLAYNLNRSLHDPFTKPQSRMTKYHLWVWSTSLTAGVATGLLHEYRPNLHLCWSCHGLPASVNWLLLYGWLVAYWLLAAGYMVDAYFWTVHSRRVTERLSSRSAQLRSSILYVAIFGLHWGLAAITFGLIFGQPGFTSPTTAFTPALLEYRLLFAANLGLLGITDAISWLATSLPALHEMRLQRRLGRLMEEFDVEQQAAERSDGPLDESHDGAVAAADSSSTASSSSAAAASHHEGRLPLWHGKNRLNAGLQKAQNKKRKANATSDIGDVSEALRREFVQFAVAGVAQTLDGATSTAQQRTAELLHGTGGEGMMGHRSRNVSNAVQPVGGIGIGCGGGGGGGGGYPSATSAGGVELRDIANGGRGGGGGVEGGGRGHSPTASHSRPGRSTSDERAARELPADGQLPMAAFEEETRTELALDVFFKDLAPRAFAKLRATVFGLSDDQYIEGLMGEASGLRGLSTRAVVDQMVLSFSEGKGGGFFFWSIDRRFMVKTLEPGEYLKLRALLPQYYRHMWTRRKSLLPRFYGAYSITIQNHEKHFVVMESVFRDAPKGKVHQVYDLKGSWIDRHAGIKAAHGGTYKDMDLHTPLKLEPSVAEALLEELRHDTRLLMNANLMDYSLLLGVHNQPVATHGLPGLKVAETSAGSVASEVDVPGYFMGLIDVLQAWNLSKRSERYAKNLFKGRFAKEVKDGMSAVEPNLYRRRFLAGIGYQLGVPSPSDSEPSSAAI